MYNKFLYNFIIDILNKSFILFIVSRSLSNEFYGRLEVKILVAFVMVFKKP